MENLSDTVSQILEPLFEMHPPTKALDKLVVTEPPASALVGCVKTVLRDPALSPPVLQAAVWLYVDDLDRSHVISQGIDDITGSFWHGIMHRREGDFSNSHYWFNKVGHHPAMPGIGGYDAHEFITAVEDMHTDSPTNLIELQRREWAILLTWSATEYTR